MCHYSVIHSVLLLTCVRQGPGSIDEDHVCRQGNYDDPVGQSDQPALPLSVPLREGPAEQQIEAGPANQAAEHLQHCHGHLQDQSISVSSPRVKIKSSENESMRCDKIDMQIIRYLKSASSHYYLKLLVRQFLPISKDKNEHATSAAIETCRIVNQQSLSCKNKNTCNNLRLC